MYILRSISIGLLVVFEALLVLFYYTNAVLTSDFTHFL